MEYDHHHACAIHPLQVSTSSKMTSSLPNTALYVDSNDIFYVRSNFQLPQPDINEIIVRVTYSGISPADIKHSGHLGVVNTVLGYDFCGEVVYGNGTSFSVGDKVAGITPTGVGRPTRYGAHQGYLACPKDMIWRVPDNLPEHHAAGLTVVVPTAADVLFNPFDLPLPNNEADADSDSKDTYHGPMLI
jgi:NADPH:quinone reductase-like Zn-dependent oxidoreductase